MTSASETSPRPTSRGIRSQVTSAGVLELTLEDAPVRSPAADEVLVRVEAAPINPSDLWVLLGPADLSTMRSGGTPDRPQLTAAIPPGRMGVVASRLDQRISVGVEGAGIVVEAGSDAQQLVGRRVSMMGGGMYTELRRVRAADCLELPDDVSAAEGAASYVNPMTALAMVECLRRDGHSALVHTAAASNLGQMLNRICLADGIGLVNVVRSPEQAAALRDAGAEHVVDSSGPDFESELTDAIAATGATLAFEAVGGGTLANTILAAMERAAARTATDYSPYGSSTLKQVYLYGALDRGPTILDRTYGMGWAVGGFLLPWFLESIGPTERDRLRARVARELRTTFASHYAGTLSMAEALQPDVVERYARRSTGTKYLVDPTRR